MNSIPLAIERLGGLTQAGQSLGVSKGVVFQWRLRGQVPAEYCPSIEKLTGVLCEELNSKVDWKYLRSAASKSSKKRRSSIDQPA